LERDRIFSDKLVADAARNDLEVLHVDRNRPPDWVVTELAALFGLGR